MKTTLNHKYMGVLKHFSVKIIHDPGDSIKFYGTIIKLVRLSYKYHLVILL